MHRSIVGLTSAALLVMAASCSMMPPPVPMLGARDDIRQLEGAWSGDYYSASSGRHGSISFSLAAGADTAFGDVVIVPPHRLRPGTGASSIGVHDQPPVSVAIAFVRAEGDSVYGYLDPYEDPEKGGMLVSWFAGRLRADAIEGEYVTRSANAASVTRGEWKVRRSR